MNDKELTGPLPLRNGDRYYVGRLFETHKRLDSVKKKLLESTVARSFETPQHKKLLILYKDLDDARERVLKEMGKRNL